MLSSLLLFVGLLSASPPQFQLRSLENASSKSFQLEAKPKVFIVFQPDCTACHQQVKDLQCLNKTEIILVGAFASETNLRKAARKLPSQLPKFYGDLEFLKKFKIKNSVTPQILIATARGGKIIEGYVPCSKIIRQLN